MYVCVCVFVFVFVCCACLSVSLWGLIVLVGLSVCGFVGLSVNELLCLSVLCLSMCVCVCICVFICM